MFDSTTKRLLDIQNEMYAQKSGSTMNYGALTTPDTTPTAGWSGTVSNLINTVEGVNARWIATFTRTDSTAISPPVKFPYSYSLGRSLYDDLIASGAIVSVSGRDKSANDDNNFFDGLYEIGSNYVKWYIEVGNQWYYAASNGTTVNLTVQAISSVQGSLTLERVV